MEFPSDQVMESSSNFFLLVIHYIYTTNISSVISPCKKCQQHLGYQVKGPLSLTHKGQRLYLVWGNTFKPAILASQQWSKERHYLSTFVMQSEILPVMLILYRPATIFCPQCDDNEYYVNRYEPRLGMGKDGQRMVVLGNRLRIKAKLGGIDRGKGFRGLIGLG